ncbi:MAG: antitoxin [Actinomycetota bacterium]
MLERRLQILLDEERYRRVADQARRRGVSVARVIREAIDASIPGTGSKRSAAARRILEAQPMPVPEVAALRDELDDLRGRRK